MAPTSATDDRPDTMRGPFRAGRGRTSRRGTARRAGGWLLAALLAAACGTEGAADGEPAVRSGEAAAPSAVRDSVLTELRSYYGDFSARDWEAFVDHFWPDATITTVWRPPGEERERVTVQTAEAFAEAGPEGPGSREIFEEEMMSHRADVDEEAGVAVVWADYRARFGDPGDVAEWRGTDVFTLLRHGGRWRIASLVFVPEDGEDSTPDDGPETGASSSP